MHYISFFLCSLLKFDKLWITCLISRKTSSKVNYVFYLNNINLVNCCYNLININILINKKLFLMNDNRLDHIMNTYLSHKKTYCCKIITLQISSFFFRTYVPRDICYNL